MKTAAAPADDNRPEKENGTRPGQSIVPFNEKSQAAEASSAHARINVSLNLDNWKHLPQETADELLWFHQYLLTNRLNWTDATEALGYDRSTIYRALRGIYEGSWPKVVKSIKSFRELVERRALTQQNEFTENSISKLVFAALDFCLANNGFKLIIGESRSGKSTAAKEWQKRNNHGRSVYVTANAVGGTKGFLRRIAEAVGVNRSQPAADMADAIMRSFNKNRILIVDQAHWLLPGDERTSNPGGLNFLQDLFDVTGCAIALISTKRLPDRLAKGAYLYEQIVGRAGRPTIIPKEIKRSDVLPIIEQFIKTPSRQLIDELVKMANQPGRLGIMVELLKAASRIAARKREKLIDESHVLKALAMSNRMSSGQRSEDEEE
jgi:DNA transposition AAA+ family ATPase